MSTVIAVVAPEYLIEGISTIVREQPGAVALPIEVADSAELTSTVQERSSEIDGWLFASADLLAAARRSGRIQQPAVSVESTGETLVQALLRLTRAGHDIRRTSIDTISADDVWQTYKEIGVSASDVHVMPHSVGESHHDIADFHLDRWKRFGTTTAITSLPTVHDAIKPTTNAFLLAPLLTSVRIAVRHLLLSISNQLLEDAQVAVGMIQMSDGDADLAGEAMALAGSVARTASGDNLIVTTRGPLMAATNGFTSLPMLGRLAEHHKVVRIGFGLGGTAAEAERRARHALARARVLGDIRAVLSLRDGTDMVLAVPMTIETAEAPSLAVMGKRVGLSANALRKLQHLREAHDGEPVTTRDVADYLDVQLRTARRMIQRLELAGLAERAGRVDTGSAGHPPLLYRLTL